MTAALYLLIDLCLIGACVSVCSIPLWEWAERRFGMENEL